MTSEPSGDVRSLRLLTASDAAAASAILRQADMWSRQRGVPLWIPDEISPERCATWAQQQIFFGGFDAHVLSAVFSLTTEDQTFWPAAGAGEAIYLHKVACSRDAAGRGWLAQILDFATDYAVARGVPLLRLDTVADSPLVALYERNRFCLVDASPIIVGGRAFALMARPTLSERPGASPTPMPRR